MKTFSLIVVALFLIISFQNCAQDPYATSDDQASKSSSPGDFFDEEVDITDDIGAGDVINLPDSNTGGSSQYTQEFYDRILEIRTMPTEKPSNDLYLATPSEFLLMTDNELKGIGLKLQEFDKDNKVSKNINMVFDLRNIQKLDAAIVVEDTLAKTPSTTTSKVRLPENISRSIVMSLKKITVCEYILQKSAKPMCEQVITNPHTTKYFPDGRSYSIGYKEDKCPIRYYDICPSTDALHRSLLNYIGSNHESWIKNYGTDPQ